MKISGAKIYDPTSGEEGKLRDIFTDGSTVVSSAASRTGRTPEKVVDASSLVCMAGALDIHTHLLSLSQLARLTGSGLLAEFADPIKIMESYRALGYSYFVEAGVTDGQALDPESSAGRFPISHGLLSLSGTKSSGLFLAAKHVGEKGVENLLADLDTGKCSVAPRVHLPHLAAGEGFATLENFLQKLSGQSCHISHLSHHCFERSGKKLVSAAQKAARLLNKYKNVTFDSAPISFGSTLIFTAEKALSKRIASVAKKETISHPKSPYTALPYNYLKDCYTDAMLWINGMEFLLYLEDVSKAALSVDFPSGGRHESYPFIIACLMDRDKRNAFLHTLNPDAVKASTLGSIKREYSLFEIARVTRSSPAAACGFENRGSLREGSVADIVLYEPHGDIEKMFANPRHVIMSGEPLTAAELL
jgi:formylmethanofuran dehydrogenase subunit A